ncbi:MAG: RNA 3'-terminal phosphate cyclase [Maricaulaceae bacterium]
MTREIIIDGSEGEGGGQVLRTSLSLSAITGKPVRIENVRGKRKKPGLFRQHLTALNAAAEICGARTEGAELKSSEIAFHPGEIKGGEYEFSIGSAGATNLVAQTILPILAHAKEPSTAIITGGTHNAWAPTFDFLDQAFLPQFRKMGGRASAELTAYGFYPAGGGSLTLKTEPIEAKHRLDLMDRGDRVRERAVAVVANLGRSIANRELKTLVSAMGLKDDIGEALEVESPGPGNALTLFLEHENVTEVFIGLGEHGVRAESVAKSVAAQAQKYLIAQDASGQIKTAVGEHLADQLLLPMALMDGGVFTATDITQHTRTNIDIIQRFLDVDISLAQLGRKCWKIEVTPK